MKTQETGVTLDIRGNLTIERAVELKTAIWGALLKHHEVKVSVEGTPPVDISFLQLMCSAHRTALRDGKLFDFREGPPDSIITAACESGYSRHGLCTHGTPDNCLWTRRRS